MNPGDLRHRIKIPGSSSTVENEVEELIPVPGKFISVWAKVDPLRGREYQEAQKLRPELTYRVTIRYRKDIHSDMIIEWEGRKLELISPPIDVHGEKRYMELMCIEKVKTV